MTHDPALDAFCAFYNKLDKSSTKHLPEVYTDDIRFVDPLHEIEGIDALIDYFDALYTNVSRCHFDFGERQRQGDLAFVTWTMHLVHPKLAGGRKVSVTGCSRLRFRDARVCDHRDYFDAGALLYEQIPILGSVIRGIKRRLG